MQMRLGLPVVRPNDSTYNTRYSSDSNYVYFNQNHFDYARYDFTESMKKPATLKLWLASKRGDE